MANLADGASIDLHRNQLALSLDNVAVAMRQCATMADHFAQLIRASAVTPINPQMVHGHPALQAPVAPNGGGIVSAPLAESNDGEKTRKRKAPTEEVAEEGKKKRSKKPKDPNAPRRPASSYILYQNHVRKDLRAKFPTLSNAELLSMISKQWAEMTEDEKLIYHQATADAKEKFQADKKAYENRSPEEVAAATMAAEEAAAAKKVRKPRAPKAPKAPVQQLAVPAAPKAVVSSSHDEGSDESDEESDEDIPAPPKAVPTKPVQQSDSEEEESDEEDEEDEDDPPAKRQKSTPAPAGKRRNHA
ncbi:HMG-box [Pleurotus eryngii]|uniref:HMG-box n=1 Tax=Pleurotus eryngii TaxID=5323 RepID=A0A9P6A3A5_PLEER|nr:HMG-box [Pleurotus eryngii]